MEKENKADLCSVLVKLGLAVMSVAYPQTGSQASLASAGVDVVLSVVKSVGLLKEEKDDSIDGQLKECIANVLARIQSSRLWYYIVPYLPEELYTYYVHGNGDIGKEGPHDENGIQRYRLTRGFFLEDRPEFARILKPECYQVAGDSVTPLCVHFGRLEMICVRHKKALDSQKGMENLITYMYLDEKMGEAILARDSADLAWVSNLSSATYEILWGVFDRHIGNDKGYYSWNYVAPWQNNKMIGCFETFHVTLIDRDTGELSVPVEYEPGLALAGCDFSNIRANDSVKELIKNTGGVI